ncbi:MAG: hypothetical protein ACHQ5A_08920 [Opitutales bacterium]
MTKKCLISIVVLFIVSMILDFLLHGLLLKADYASEPALMRTAADAQRHFPAMLLAHLFLAAGITAIYHRGREPGKAWTGQGLRFGLWFAVAACIPNFLIYYAVQPMGLILAVKQIVLGSVVVIVLGLVAAALNQAEA